MEEEILRGRAGILDSIDEEEWLEEGRRHNKQLTLMLVSEQSDGALPGNVTTIELVFQPVTAVPLSTLAALSSLTSLTLIRTGLSDLPPLGPVSKTLKRLDLSSQGIASIASMPDWMPSLDTVILKDNIITHIDGLDGCLALRRLWLQSNKIKVRFHPDYALFFCHAFFPTWCQISGWRRCYTQPLHIVAIVAIDMRFVGIQYYKTSSTVL